MGLEAVMQRPEKGYMRNETTGETVTFLMNPDQASESVSAEYEMIRPHAFSQSLLSYKGTSNTIRPLTFWVSRLAAVKYLGIDLDLAYQFMIDFRNFMQSLTVPDGRFVSEGLVGAEPPTILLCWPGTFTGKVKITRLDIQYERFDPKGRPMAYSAVAEFIEWRIGMKWSEDVRFNGIHWL